MVLSETFKAAIKPASYIVAATLAVAKSQHHINSVGNRFNELRIENGEWKIIGGTPAPEL